MQSDLVLRLRTPQSTRSSSAIAMNVLNVSIVSIKIRIFCCFSQCVAHRTQNNNDDHTKQISVGTRFAADADETAGYIRTVFACTLSASVFIRVSQTHRSNLRAAYTSTCFT